MATKHFVVEDIDAVTRAGLTVYDASGERIGSVKDYSNAAAYLVVQSGLLAHEEFYVPYSAITSIDPGEVCLNLDTDALTCQYSAQTFAAGEITTVVPGGYDGSPAVVKRVKLEVVRRDLTRGMTIYATLGDRVGTVDGIDEAAGYLVAKRNPFSQQDFFIPFAAINCIVLGEVFLTIPKDVLLKEYARLLEGVVLHIDGTDAPAVEPPSNRS